jgi:hypothetical protein
MAEGAAQCMDGYEVALMEFNLRLGRHQSRCLEMGIHSRFFSWKLRESRFESMNSALQKQSFPRSHSEVDLQVCYYDGPTDAAVGFAIPYGTCY